MDEKDLTFTLVSKQIDLAEEEYNNGFRVGCLGHLEEAERRLFGMQTKIKKEIDRLNKKDESWKFPTPEGIPLDPKDHKF